MKWFETALVVLTLLTGVIWLLDRLVLARRRARKAGLLEPKEPVLVDYSRAFFPVLFVVLILRSFVAEPFRIPSSSMMPTLLIGDFILVNKFSYGIRLPITNRKVIDIGEPARGDVVVFRPPHQPDQDWIKRVIGLPGDTVEFRDNQISVNGVPFAYQREGTYEGVGRGREMTGASLYTEQMPDRAHEILHIDQAAPFHLGEGTWTVPQGHYFVMGDNRDRSDDGRFWGTLPESQLRGKAFLIWMNVDSSAPGWVDWGRIGQGIR
ncbi:signal peptidase I [Luteimonas sp. BDR2-5]|uniref:signal peptidase I n=1 Tax=Proluteimonas luteida TaxID=2878685 RepID=UPI001E300BFA|nr:signal peptidase I [Luteimonas sp. BDR2-5]MCD9028454.1 signal peptidase I [Luteimonas sp. BDR2-5]